MNEKRRDNKGRLLYKGEMQEKDGRYRYTYTDLKGKRRTVYSWTLTDTDRIPEGKNICKSLRAKKKEIQFKLAQGINDTNMTVLELLKTYYSLKTNVKPNTKAAYKTVYNIIKEEDFGYLKIKNISMLKAQEFLVQLYNKRNQSYATIHRVRKHLKPAFRLAVRDRLILDNPFDFALSSILKDTRKKRTSISSEDEKRFLDFCREDKFYQRYYDAFYILFNTGLRISELCGLTLKDINFEAETFNVTKQLQRVQNPETNKMEFAITSTKTITSQRELPMTTEVKKSFERIVRNRRKPITEKMIDEYTGFIFVKQNGSPMVGADWLNKFKRATAKYNETHSILLPKITPHICRHTYCTKMAKTGINPKTLQYLMGHANIKTTLDTYTHIGLEDARKELKRLII